jgi:hypothetical protein
MYKYVPYHVWHPERFRTDPEYVAFRILRIVSGSDLD